MSISAHYDPVEAAAQQDAVLSALISAELANPGSPHLEILHTALESLQAFLLAGVDEDSEDQPPAPRSGGDKTKPPTP